MKSPLNWKSESSMMLMMLLLFGGALATRIYLPNDQQTQTEAAGVFMGVFIGIIAVKTLEARLKGQPLPHRMLTIRVPPSGLPLQRDFFFEVTDPIKQVVDVTPLTPRDPRTGVELPVRMDGRFYWVYLGVTKFGIELRELGFEQDVFSHIFVLTSTWDAYWKAYRREEAAFVMGELIDHGNSDCGTVYASPFKHTFLDTDMPVYFGVEGADVYKEVTRSWGKTIEAIARMDMQKVIAERESEIWPNKELEKIGYDDLPPEARKRIEQVLARER